MRAFRHIRELTIGDRMAEAVYAIWMLVVSIGLVNATGNPEDPGVVWFAIGAALTVNVVWGVIDGLTVMYGSVIGRAEADRLLHALRTRRNDASVRREAEHILRKTLVGALPEEERNRVLEMIAAGPPPPSPSETKYRATDAERSIAYGLLTIELLFIPPILLPLVVFSATPRFGVLISYLVGAALVAYLGVEYAKQMNRNRIVAFAVMAGLLLTVAVFTYASGG